MAHMQWCTNVILMNMRAMTRARIKKRTTTASINQKLNWTCRGHYKEHVKIGFAVKAFFYIYLQKSQIFSCPIKVNSEKSWKLNWINPRKLS